MTTKTEETKHAMFQHLEGVKKTIKKGFSPRAKMSDFESALEEHLEALHQEYEFMKSQLMTCRQTNMDIQARLHAVDHAYFLQSQANLAAGDQLRDAHALIGRQRGAIADMYMASRAVTVQPKPAECRHENLHNSCCTDCGRLVLKRSFINLSQTVKP